MESDKIERSEIPLSFLSFFGTPRHKPTGRFERFTRSGHRKLSRPAAGPRDTVKESRWCSLYQLTFTLFGTQGWNWSRHEKKGTLKETSFQYVEIFYFYKV